MKVYRICCTGTEWNFIKPYKGQNCVICKKMGVSEDHIQCLNPNRERHVSRVSLSVKFGFSNMWHAVKRRDVCDEEGQHKPGQWGWIWADYMMYLCRKSGWNPWLCQWLHTKQAQELWVLTEIKLTLRWKKFARVVITHSCCVSGTVCAHLPPLTTWYSPKLSNQYGKTSTSCLDGTAPSSKRIWLRKCPKKVFAVRRRLFRQLQNHTFFLLPSARQGFPWGVVPSGMCSSSLCPQRHRGHQNLYLTNLVPIQNHEPV